MIEQMIRLKCPATLNFVLNRSDIYPSISPEGGPEYIDASSLLSKDDTVFLTDGSCFLLFWKTGDNLYEGDIYAPARKRGPTARKAAHKAIAFMFTQTEAETIEIRVPTVNKASRHFSSGLGFQRKGIVPSAWKKDGALHDVIVYGLEKSSWAESSAQ